MNGEIYQISSKQFLQMVGSSKENLDAARLSSEIIVGIYNSEPLCFIGLAPRTMLSDVAYLWMITTDAGLRHKFMLGRYARGVVQTALLKYKCLFGNCLSADSIRWLRSLGAEFTSDTEFEIRRGE